MCDAIHAMGGLTYACHPFDRRRANFDPNRLVQLAPRLDIIETHNARASAGANQAAGDLCRELGLVAATGSDSHSLLELGRTWMEIEPYDGAAGFLEKLAWARHVVTDWTGGSRRA